MEKTKHTPGPWAWRKFGWVYCLVADHGGRKVVLDAECLGQNETPALMTRDFEDESILKQLTPDHPNARLIAAAPEMYEAAQELLKNYLKCSQNPHNDPVVPHRYLDALRNAILKAELI